MSATCNGDLLLLYSSLSVPVQAMIERINPVALAVFVLVPFVIGVILLIELMVIDWREKRAHRKHTDGKHNGR